MKRCLCHLTFVAALTGSFALAQSMPQRQNPANIPPPSQQQPPTTSDQAKTAASATDVQNEIQSALQKDSSLANSNISVEVSGQNIELSGTVPTKEDKATAEQIAKAHSGGLNVKNHIKVAGKSGSSPGDTNKT